jgi:pyridoxamine 5'-phosphate oxidase
MGLSMEELQSLRQNYKMGQLDEDLCPDLPVELFSLWLKEAINSKCDEPNAFNLSTAVMNKPSARIVLLKGVMDEGITFFTNYNSPKGQQISQNSNVAATFLWLPLERQVRIEGVVQKIPSDQSQEYFSKRPYGSRIGAIASPQGQVVSSRKELEDSFEQTKKKYPEGSFIPCPEFWGGYLIQPTSWEFWQGRENRLHDRIKYEFDQKWIKQRLAP